MHVKYNTVKRIKVYQWILLEMKCAEISKEIKGHDKSQQNKFL